MITDLLAGHARATPDAVFLRGDDGEHGFAAVLGASRRFATQLRANGVGPGDHVALLAGNGVPYLVAMFGIAWIGGVVVALNNELVADGLCHSLAQSRARLIVADEPWIAGKRKYLTPELAALPQIVLPGERAFLASLDGLPETGGERVDDSATCTILYTSGTTGLPKGVMNSHACYQAVGRDTVVALRLKREDRTMVFLPLFHTNPQMYAVMSALTVGSSLVLRPRFSASSFFEDARRFGATGFTFVGTVMSILAIRHPEPRRDHGLRFAIGGGTPTAIWEAMQQRFGFLIHELYGMTEIGGWVSCCTAEAHRIGSCGRLRRSMDVRIFDEHDREVPAGEVGEIVVRPLEPDVILSGYFGRPEALVECTRNLWFHTGDRGSFDADGYLYFQGRRKELIRKGGEMISPVEIETRLRTLPGVEDCAVVGVDDPVFGEEIKAVVVASTALEPGAVVAHLDGAVPRFMLPRYVEFAAAIPKTETEKIQRHRLRYVDATVHDLRRAES